MLSSSIATYYASKLLFPCIKSPWSQNIWGQLHSYWKWNKLSAAYLEQSLFTHENQFIVPIVFLNELGGKKHVFNMDSYFLSFYSVISIHPLFFSQSIKIVGLSTSAAGVKSVSLIRAVTFHPQQKKTPPPPRTLKQYFSKCGGINSIIKNVSAGPRKLFY